MANNKPYGDIRNSDMTEFKRFLTEEQVEDLATKLNNVTGFGREVYGIRAPMFRKGEDISLPVAESMIGALKLRGLSPDPRDIFAVTEAVAAKDVTQGPEGNIVCSESVAEDIRNKTGGGHTVLANPICSRNRMAHIIGPLSRSSEKLTIVLGLMEDEQGNTMIDRDDFWVKHKNHMNPTELFTKADVESVVGYPMAHAITGKNYGDLYESIGDNIEVFYALDPAAAAATVDADAYIAGDVHTRSRTMDSLTAGGGKVFSLADFMNSSNGGGYNEEFGLIGSNKLGDLIKLFPRREEATQFLHRVIDHIKRITGVTIERALVFGDGAYKDPEEQIWELADPAVAPASIGLEDMPNEVKVKDRNEYYKSMGLSDKEAAAYTQYEIDNKYDNMQNLGTTPRKLKDLVGSLADLTSGSGDKGTPIVYIRNY
jgi:hypothetical protein